MTSRAVQAFEHAFAEYQEVPAARAFWMGRIGLYAVMRALGVKAGDRVGICAYTCLGVVESVTRLGARPLSLDVNREMNISPASLAALSAPPAILLVQHTFGVPGPLDEYVLWCQANRVPLIEDCCHAPGATWEGRKVGTMGVGSVFSLEWSKPFSTGRGGIFAFTDAALAAKWIA